MRARSSRSISVGITCAGPRIEHHRTHAACRFGALREQGGERGRVTVFDEEMLSEKRYRRLVERELQAAVYLGELSCITSRSSTPNLPMRLKD
jgi:hypothetical protein